MRIDDMTKTIEKGPLTFVIEWHYDENPLYDFIGEYKAKGPEEGYIDRQKGVLYGEAVEEPDYPCDECGDQRLCALAENECPAVQSYDKAFDEWDNNYGLEVLADELGGTWERNSYEFFVPYAGGEKPGSEHFVKYAIQDYDRITGLERGHWCFMGCTITLSVDGIELGYDSVYGIESDCGDEYITEIESEEIAELMHDVPEYKEKLAAVLKALEEGDWKDD